METIQLIVTVKVYDESAGGILTKDQLEHAAHQAISEAIRSKADMGCNRDFADPVSIDLKDVKVSETDSIGDELMDTLRKYARLDDCYINPNFLAEIRNNLHSWCNIDDVNVDNWIDGMYSR